jgi:hypothetical protein
MLIHKGKWIKKAEDVTCSMLWKEWSSGFPDDRLVLIAKERISKYTREDWDEMIKEAHELNSYLAECINNKVPVEDPKAEHGWDLFVDHFVKWFFPVNEEYLIRLRLQTQVNKKYALFFEKQAPGLNSYLLKLSKAYAYKRKDGLDSLSTNKN